ncbi:winged helix-turn-helix domain-containing tetratricopeptide repeat protein [Seongchinamella sediminis]|uniref:winged helix-turn-helix domain-containing tetratricopeptide repeat protein n=1 Tax=Seongchinamella sediminis TaxID=2283635 RepID=UPI0013C33C7A|nr:winged helix-turn-helix domain-containing protein [Seongchinamella sediminis]
MAASKQTGQGSDWAGGQQVARSAGAVSRQFGGWKFNADTGDLHGADGVVRLEPKVAALLSYLLDHQHQLISRDELIATVWDGRSVSDDAITRCVSILRQLLSPDDKQGYIETVVRKGYIAHFPPPAEGEASQSPPVRKRFLWLAAVASAVVFALVLLFDSPGGAPVELRQDRLPGPPLVAVLPFATASDSGESAFLADGMFEDLLTQLSKLQALRVISSTSTREYRNVARNLRQIGAELGADFIIEGNVQIAGERLRINAQLIDARSDEHVWAQRYDRDLTLANVFDIQSEIASAIAGEMKATLTRADQLQLALIPTDNMAAYRAYHRAIHMRDTIGYSVLGTPQYIEALEEAVALDPTFSRALAELASTLAFANFQGKQPELTRRAEQVLEQLQRVAPGSADHLIGQAAYVYYTLRDFDRAHDILSQALQLSPSNIWALQMKSWVERRQGDFDAYVSTRYETRRLDPRDPERTDELLLALLVTHRYREAWTESTASGLQSFRIGHTRLLQRYSRDRDMGRFQAGVDQLCQRYREADCGWNEYVANRDYARALAVLSLPDEADLPAPDSGSARRWLYTVWLTGDSTALTHRLPDWKQQLATSLETVKPYHRSPLYLSLALIAIAERDAAAARQWIQRWEHNTPVDRAERMNRRHDACRVLGMAADAAAAAQCIGVGLAEASLVMPFMEPWLPFYDSVRQSPEFAALLAQLESSGS